MMAKRSTWRTATTSHYGFWLKKTTDKDGATTYNEVETFAGSSDDMATGDTDLRVLPALRAIRRRGGRVREKRDRQSRRNPHGHSRPTRGESYVERRLHGGDVAANNQFTIDGTVTPSPCTKLTVSGNIDWGVSLSGGEDASRLEACDVAKARQQPQQQRRYHG